MELVSGKRNDKWTMSGHLGLSLNHHTTHVHHKETTRVAWF